VGHAAVVGGAANRDHVTDPERSDLDDATEPETVPWRSCWGDGRVWDARDLGAGAEEIAPTLLGGVLESTIGGELVVGRIVEVEAYVGPHDPASHAAERIGRTARNRTMFGPAGLAYIYRSYGMHWCVNVVTGRLGVPQAVLIRALEPLAGADAMISRRKRDRDLCSGPGRLCQALGITGALDGHELKTSPLVLRCGERINQARVARGPRVGISRAVDWPLRFWVEGNSHVSRAPRRVRKTAATHE